jgi:hypothetical protein
MSTRPRSPRRRAETSTSWRGSSSSSAPRSRTPAWRQWSRGSSTTPPFGRGYAGGLLEHTVAVATICREATQIHPRLRSDLLLAAALLHDAGRSEELGAGPLFLPTAEGALLGHVHLGLRLIEARASALQGDVRAELLHAVASHHDARGARTAEAAVLYHANQLDAVAATRPVSPESASASSETASGTSL